MAKDDELRILVRRAQHRDPDAWEALFRRAHPRLRAYARRRVGHPEQAEDAVSETFTRAIDAIGGFSWRGAGFDGWLFGICRNVLLEMARRNGRAVPQPLPDVATTAGGPLDTLLIDEEREALRHAFARLSPDDQELLELRVVGRLDSAEVGAVLGKRPGAVRMAQARAVARLRRLLEEVASSDR